MRLFPILFLSAAAIAVFAQSSPSAPAAGQSVWQLEDSGTKANLRGVFSVDGKVAWASGARGTVLRTVDGGAHWQQCTVPDVEADGVMLDFRGVQAWDAQTAIVMASGPGDKSRLYKTTDGGINWDLLISNPDKDGFWDAIKMTSRRTGYVIGDAVKGPFVLEHHTIERRPMAFPLYTTQDGGESWHRIDGNLLYAKLDEVGDAAESIFAASNSALLSLGPMDETLFITGGLSGSLHHVRFPNGTVPLLCKGPCAMESRSDTALGTGKTAGGFSLGAHWDRAAGPVIVAVGGDFNRPDATEGTASTCVLSTDTKGGEFRCRASSVPPHGYRSSVEWSEALDAWIAVGTNGSDVSRDEGKTWKRLDDGNWNAVSLPFVVGPKGRIAKMNAAAVAKP